jgi:hypothetical protein
MAAQRALMTPIRPNIVGLERGLYDAMMPQAEGRKKLSAHIA